ncbi:hypothetical protein F4678DRAFT_446246 [Xylaria arbuscula]|nr:hypothetical protein F4678DRAFT_446246 [Xylaria arbuscula]
MTSINTPLESALESPWENWGPYCEFIALLTYDEFNLASHGSCDPSPVFAILLDTFNDRAGPENRGCLLAGAAACVCKLGSRVRDHIVSRSWSLDDVWEQDVSVVSWEVWLGWSERFKGFAKDGSQSRETKKQASQAAVAMIPKSYREAARV